MTISVNNYGQETDSFKSGERIEIPLERSLIPRLLGPNDSHLRLLEKRFNTSIIVRDSSILLPKEVEGLGEIIAELAALCREKDYLDAKDVETIIRLHRANSISRQETTGLVVLENPQVLIKTRSLNQEKYIKAMRDNELVFSIGPAGTGKTFLAVAWAVSLFEKGDVQKIVLVKPAVEAGEKLGFLPGDLKEKVDPYFKPLYDALLFMLPSEKVRRLIDQSVIEIAPLAYMRGRTLNHAFAILDEAQNTTTMQMKMFLTRLGAHSRAVITGDLTQIDLDDSKTSGLLEVRKILTRINGIEFAYLDSTDVVRHKLVSDIIKAYDDYQGGEPQSS